MTCSVEYSEIALNMRFSMLSFFISSKSTIELLILKARDNSYDKLHIFIYDNQVLKFGKRVAQKNAFENKARFKKSFFGINRLA